MTVHPQPFRKGGQQAGPVLVQSGTCLNIMKIDLTCPVEVLRCRLNDDDHHAADVTLNNLSKKEVTSTEVTLILHMREEEENTRVLFRAHDLHAQPGDPYTFQVPLPSNAGTPDKIEVMIEKIWYDDATVWRRGKAPMTEYEPNALSAGRELEKLRYVAGRQAVGYPEEQEHVWLCVCGRPNAYASDRCAHCGNTREEVFRLYSKESVQAYIQEQETRLKAQSRAAVETSNRRQQAREAAWEQKKKVRRRWLTACLVLLILAGIGYLTVFHALPYVRYRQAVSALESGAYDEAITAFEKMNPYRDSADMLTRAYYSRARDALADADMDTLLEIRETFQSLGTYLDSATLLKQADYQRAELLLGDGHTSDAMELFESLGSYKDSASRVTECNYIKAGEMQSSGDYEAAMAVFEALGEYQDSTEKARACRLAAAEAALEQENPDHALELLPDSLITEDASQLRQRAHYQIGQRLYDAGEMVQAGQEFLKAGDYTDAADRARLCIYTPASQAMAERDYLTAADMFASIPGYQDADELYLQCLYLAAKDALKDTEYKRATSLLSQLPADYEDTDTLRKECVYRPAVAALERGAYEEALNAFLSLGEYSDCPRMVQRTRYAWAEALVKEGKLQEAISLYETLGNYLRAPALLKETRYALAEARFNEGDYQEAEAIYLDLGNYKQSRNKLNQVRYARAESLLGQQDYTAAREAFEQLGSYSDSRTRVRECDYHLALQLMEQENYEQAAEAFDALEDYEDSPLKAKACRYALAEALLAAGNTEQARAMFVDLDDYEDAAERVLEIDYQEAERLSREGMHEQAAAQFIALGEYRDAATRAQSEYYALATDAAEEGQQGTAAVYYEKAGDYEDAQDRSDSYSEMLYDEPAALARLAAEREDWPAIAWILSGLDLTQLPENYSDLKPLFEEACLKAGMDLVASGDMDRAYPYLQRVWDHADVQALVSERRELQLMGVWEGNEHTLVLRGDHTAQLDGESCDWALDGYMLIMNGNETLSLVSEPDADTMIVRNRRATGIESWTLTRSGKDDLLPIPEVSLEALMNEENATESEEPAVEQTNP